MRTELPCPWPPGNPVRVTRTGTSELSGSGCGALGGGGRVGLRVFSVFFGASGLRKLGIVELLRVTDFQGFGGSGFRTWHVRLRAQKQVFSSLGILVS